MANLDDVQNKQIGATDPNAPQAGAPATSGAPLQVSAGGSGDVTSGVSTAGVGAGGTGGWTNIQAYLNANPSGSGDTLNNTVTKQFDQDTNKIQTDSADAQAKGQSEVDNNKLSNDQGSQLLDQYVNKAPGTDPNQIKSQVQSALFNQYQGPKQYTASLSGASQNYGDALATDQGFQGLMGQLYNTAAGGQISKGQLDLQNELDANNPNLAQTRSNLSTRYQKLGQMVGDTNTATNSALTADQAAYNTNQSGLNDYYKNLATGYKSTYLQDQAAQTPGQVSTQAGQNMGLGRQIQPGIDIPKSANYYNGINDFMKTGGNLDPNWTPPPPPPPVAAPAGGGGADHSPDNRPGLLPAGSIDSSGHPHFSIGGHSFF